MKLRRFDPRAGLLLFALASPSSAQEGPALATQAQQVFRTHCYRCHGQDGANEGGINFVSDLKKLVERNKVQPKNAAKSKVYRRMVDEVDPMPPSDEKVRPSKDEVALIKRWIDA